jgi:predicted GIY-YIG superfamily endonuclease
MSERTAVYRLFAADDTLLYVGIAKRFGRRWEQHAKLQPWWPHVDHQSVYWYPSREDAALAEKHAMRDEAPVYNKAGSPWRGGAKDDGTGFYVAPKPKPKPRTYKSGPSVHRHRAITPRPPEDVREAAQNAAARQETNLNAVVVTFLRWYGGLSDTHPERPEPPAG